MAITDFLTNIYTSEEVTTTLRLLRDFKGCESRVEWLAIPFMAWGKLEQFEEFLSHMAEGTPLRNDTVEYIKKHGKVHKTARKR